VQPFAHFCHIALSNPRGTGVPKMSANAQIGYLFHSIRLTSLSLKWHVWITREQMESMPSTQMGEIDTYDLSLRKANF